MVNRNKFAKLDYVVTATDKNPVYKYNGIASFVILAVLILLTCVVVN